MLKFLEGLLLPLPDCHVILRVWRQGGETLSIAASSNVIAPFEITRLWVFN